MPVACTFLLNRKTMSILHCENIGDFAAFSGNDGWAKNNPDAAAVPKVGPLPPGRYYIVDRGSGGIFTHIKDSIMDFWSDTERGKWFALYRDDDEIDDWTFVDGVRRGNFRLHPHGRQNLSEGCVTLADPVGFYRLRDRLIHSSRMAIPGGKGFAYGTVVVR
ncbi:conserved hypothetical protein [Paraburkholderia sabiae]|nr:conserved hypothetical protein [Paraburkholderia sabiae]